ncbi:major facilitator superfamily MFS_1 [Gloeothece citriformis PCC 7424]|uniref:Major facilitator superfamily MFS_1 n=1 Tax=Gloeothece citriformis (strain PCC 7424) TaxID=65393 RepID=B7KA29_GLOC7|nr:MFS transporter [Gloeothece citriformis]ACK71385.1 major facilitator superfamily MFS_1 [Gloeothece citriformis PCC 7424]
MLSVLRSPAKQIVQCLVLLAAGCLTTMTGGIVAPVFPEILQHLHLEPRWAGMLISIHALMIALFTPILGILADRIGKLKVLIAALIFYAVFGISGAFIGHFLPLLADRALLGIASGGISAACIGLLSNMFEGEARLQVLGYATSAMTTASIFVPLLGGWVGSYNWKFAFFIYGVSLPIALAAALMLQEADRSENSALSNMMGNQLIKAITKPQVIRLFITLALAAAIVYSVVIYTPVYLNETIGADAKLNGIVLTARAIGATVVSALAANWIGKRLGRNVTIALGFILMASMLATIPVLKDISLILYAAVFFGAGFGVAVPHMYNGLAEFSPPELRSSVMAIGTGFNSLGQFICPIFLGAVWQSWGLTNVFYVTAGVGLMIAVWIVSASIQESQRQKAKGKRRI